PSKRPLLWSQHDVSKKLFALFKPLYKKLKDQPSQTPQRKPSHISRLSLPQSRPALSDISNQFLSVTYQDIKDLND
ncbi:25388_t:CDS:1, partial [Racocetra persica]